MSQQIPDYDDADLEVEVSDEMLLQLTDMVDELDTKTAFIKDMEKQVEQAKKDVEKLQMETLPGHMAKMGTNVFGIPDTDRECRIKPYYHATFPKVSIPEAVKVLEDNQLAGVVAHTLQVNMPRGEGEAAKQIQQRLQQMLAEYEIDAEATLKYGSHWKTYTAMVKEQHEAKADLPWGLLNATIGQKATITKRK